MPSLSNSNQNIQIVDSGALFYLSERTVKSQLARLYLYKESNSNFILVNSEEDFLVSQIKSQGLSDSDFVYYGGIRGPIRIWEIKYPESVKVNPEYLEVNFPNPELNIARQ